MRYLTVLLVLMMATMLRASEDEECWDPQQLTGQELIEWYRRPECVFNYEKELLIYEREMYEKTFEQVFGEEAKSGPKMSLFLQAIKHTVNGMLNLRERIVIRAKEFGLVQGEGLAVEANICRFHKQAISETTPFVSQLVEMINSGHVQEAQRKKADNYVSWIVGSIQDRAADCQQSFEGNCNADEKCHYEQDWHMFEPQQVKAN